MVATPIFGPFDVTRSTNFADNACINLRPVVTEVKDGRNIGALYGTPGLDLLTTAGSGPIVGMRHLGDATLYVVSGNSVYTVAYPWAATLVGSILTTSARVSMTDNGTQLVIFTDEGGWIAPAGHPLTGGSIGSGGANYAVNDTIILEPNNGLTSGAVILSVTAVSGGVVTAFSILQTGSFQANPTGFVQQSTTGSGSGFTLTSPAYGGSSGLMRIFLPFTPNVGQTLSVAYQDGFGVLSQPGTKNLWQSIVDDLSVWPALNNAQADADSDNVQAIIDIHRLIYVVKETNTEVWVNVGAAGFAFETQPTVLIQTGTPAAASIARMGETLVLLGKTEEGQGIVREIDGFVPKRISTHAVETLITAVPTMSDAFAYSYLQEGHQFYVLTFPIGNLTVVYDKTESSLTGIPIWYQWLSFAAGAFNRHIGNAYSFFNQTPMLGDYQNGNLYAINLNTLTDNGALRKWVRSWRALQRPAMQPMRFASLQVDMQTGVNVPDGTNPQVMLEWSDDGGNNFSGQQIRAVGKPGQTAQRVKFNRLGSTRRNSGLDRIFRLSSADQFPVCIVGAELDV